MRISVVIPSFYPATIYGGTVYASKMLTEMLSRIGYQVYVSTTNTNMYDRLKVETGKFLQFNENLFVKYYDETIVDKLSLSLIFNLWKDIRKSNIVHIQSIFNTPTPVALLYAKLWNKPVLLAPHGVMSDWIMSNGLQMKKIWLALLIKPFAKRIHWHATSQQEKREILKHFPKAVIHVIPNAIDLTEYKILNKMTKAAYLKKYAKAEGTPEKIIITMGRIHAKKGLDVLIKAFALLQKEHSDDYLLIAGEDEGEKEKLLKLIKELKLTHRIFFTGNIEGQDKVDFFHNADVFVLPSHNENFGLVYAESLAAGTPIVASQNTPWEEVEKYQCGKWVKNEVQETYEAMEEVLYHSDIQIREKSKQFAAQFSEKNVVKEYDKLFKLIAK